MPENPGLVHVLGRTADGEVWHTMRSPRTGLGGGPPPDWTPFQDLFGPNEADIPALKGHAVDVSCTRRIAAHAASGAAVSDAVYALVALDNAPPKLLLRISDPAPHWTQVPGPYFPIARKVAVTASVTTLHSTVHFAAVTDDGQLVSAFADVGETQPVQQVDDVEATAGDIGEVLAVALGAGLFPGTAPAVALLAVTADGKLMATSGRGASVADPAGQWAPWTEVLVGTPPRALPGDATDAALAGNSVVATTGDGHVWLALALSGTGVADWVDLEKISFTFGRWGTFTFDFDVGTFATASATLAREGLHVLGTTTDGHLWHQLRAPNSVFGDVEGAGITSPPEAGSFTAVDCG
jgi:hypothetical protein